MFQIINKKARARVKAFIVFHVEVLTGFQNEFIAFNRKAYVLDILVKYYSN